MGKTISPYTGLKLTDQTPLSKPGLDQQLFSSPPPRQPAKIKTQEGRKEGRKEVRKLPSLQATKESTLEPWNQGTLELPSTEARKFDLNTTPYKNDTFAFTTEELEAIEDIKLELRRNLDLHTTKNDIIRSAVHNLVEDYRRHGPDSIVVRRVRNKRGR